MTRLLPYQSEGIKRLHELDGRALLADEMGLGKSLEVLSYLKESKHRPALVVCPASLKLHWQREARVHCDLDTTILSSRTPYQIQGREGIFIINYDILHDWFPILRGFKFQVIILDECQAIGNARSQRSRTCRRLCSGISHIIGMSGTPLLNRPWELFPILSILDPQTWDSPFTYGSRFCEARFAFGRWNFSGASHLGELHQRLSESLMIRRTKAEVLPQLPPIRTSVIPVELDDRREYELAEEDVISWLATYDLLRADRAAAARHTQFGYLKRLAAKLSLRAKLGWLDCFLGESDGKILVGCIHRKETPILPTVYQRYKHLAVQIHGGCSQSQRAEAEDRFRNDPGTRMLVGQIYACGVGHNFPEATTVALLECPWTSGACQQFIGRCHRLTSTASVDAVFLIAQGTVEEKVCQIIQRKTSILDQTLDGVKQREESLSVYDELQKALQNKGNT